MIDISTGKHFNAPRCEYLPTSAAKEVAGHITTRREAIKTGLAAIIATGCTPYLTGSANANVRGAMRNVGARQSAMGGGETKKMANWIFGETFYRNGIRSDADGCYCSDYIPVDSTHKYRVYSGYMDVPKYCTQPTQVIIYRSDKSYLNYWNYGGSGYTGIGNDASLSYVRFSTCIRSSPYSWVLDLTTNVYLMKDGELLF